MKRLVKTTMEVVLEFGSDEDVPTGMHVLDMGDFGEEEYVDDGIDVATMLKSRGNRILFSEVEPVSPKGGISLP